MADSLIDAYPSRQHTRPGQHLNDRSDSKTGMLLEPSGVFGASGGGGYIIANEGY